MALPTEVDALLRKHQPNREDYVCEGAKFHSPRPLSVSTYRLANNQLIRLCGTCKSNLGVYLYLWDKEDGLDWNVQRCFGNALRQVASRVIESRRGH